MFIKQREFEAWMREVKGVPDFGGPKGAMMELFRGFMEDYNTATMPHEKCACATACADKGCWALFDRATHTLPLLSSIFAHQVLQPGDVGRKGASQACEENCEQSYKAERRSLEKVSARERGVLAGLVADCPSKSRGLTVLARQAGDAGGGSAVAHRGRSSPIDGTQSREGEIWRSQGEQWLRAGVRRERPL